MGTYTELTIAVSLRKDTPSDVIEIIRAMVTGENYPDNSPATHPLFSTERWRFMLHGGSATYPHGHHIFERDEFFERWELAVRCSFKNYSNEAQLFCEWIAPYVTDDGIVGMIRSEHNSDFASIILMANRKTQLVPVDCSNEVSALYGNQYSQSES